LDLRSWQAIGAQTGVECPELIEGLLAFTQETGPSVALHLRNFHSDRARRNKIFGVYDKDVDSACANFSRLPFYFRLPSPLIPNPHFKAARRSRCCPYRGLRPTNSWA